MKEINTLTKDIPVTKQESAEALKSYRKPELTRMGAMQKYTLGGTFGTGDSGANSATEKTPAGW